MEEQAGRWFGCVIGNQQRNCNWPVLRLKQICVICAEKMELKFEEKGKSKCVYILKLS